MNIKSLITKIEKHKKVIEKQRDELREILGNLESEMWSFDEGITLLDEAIEVLSEHV